MIESCTDREGHSLRFLVWKALKQYPTASLWQFLYDRDVIVRSAAARELQIRGGKFVYEQTKTLLKHDSKDIRELAAFILGQLGTPRRPFKTASTRDLLMLLKIEKNATVRATAVCSLGQLHAATALPTIIASANDPSPTVRGSVAFALGMIYSEKLKTISTRTMDLLKKLASDNSREVRDMANLGIELVQGPPEN